MISFPLFSSHRLEKLVIVISSSFILILLLCLSSPFTKLLYSFEIPAKNSLIFSTPWSIYRSQLLILKVRIKHLLSLRRKRTPWWKNYVIKDSTQKYYICPKCFPIFNFSPNTFFYLSHFYLWKTSPRTNSCFIPFCYLKYPKKFRIFLKFRTHRDDTDILERRTLSWRWRKFRKERGRE